MYVVLCVEWEIWINPVAVQPHNVEVCTKGKSVCGPTCTIQKNLEKEKGGHY